MQSSNSIEPSDRTYKPISDYGIIGDMHSCALIASDASIDWCCLPNFDSPSIFAAILDKKRGGRFQISPGSESTYHEYIKDTNVLKTFFKASQGAAEITDFMPAYLEDGKLITFGEIHRQVTCTEGKTSIRVHFEPRLDYARSKTKVSKSKYGCIVSDANQLLSLSTNIPLHIGDTVNGELWLSQGESELLILRYGESEPRPPHEYESEEKLRKTKKFWQEWVSRTTYQGLWREQVIRSSLVLKLLKYEPTGAIIAAPTTSLPESIGGPRNWDYRFSWLRDSSFALWALRILGHKYDADSYFRWLTKTCIYCGVDLQLMFGINGERELPEEELTNLEGYRNSRPVRVGNIAYKQFQLDVYGAVLDAVYFYHTHGEKIPQERWNLVKALVVFVARNWDRPDNGVWEVRGEQKHFVYSKLMCWVALDRGVHLARDLGFPKDAERWIATRDEIRAEIVTKGWNPSKKAFVQHYDSNELDAMVMMMPLVRFLPATDERFVSTVERIREELASGHLVYRYKNYDGLEGKEGTFTLCSFLLVDCLTLLGKVDGARRVFESLVNHAGSLGLFSEEIDAETGELLGNFPQSFTHTMLINTAINLNKAIASKESAISGPDNARG